MNRRSFLKGVVGAGAALLLPPEPDKRFFQLDRTMVAGRIESGWMDMGRVDTAKMIPMVPGSLYWNIDDFSIWSFTLGESGPSWTPLGYAAESSVIR